MFDSNAFDKMLLSDIDKIIACTKHEFFVTSIQLDEIRRIPDSKQEIRNKNLEKLSKINPDILCTIAVLGMAKLGLCVLGKGKIYDELLVENGSNVPDAMIGDAAKRENCTVVTNDKRFRNKLLQNEVNVVTYEEFLEYL